MLLYDQVIAQLSETVALNGAGAVSAERKWASGPRADLQALCAGDDAFRRWRGPATAIASTPPA